MHLPRALVPRLLLCFIIGAASAINFDVGPGKAECFYEDVHAGTTINGVYAVTHGSHLDIDVKVYEPSGMEVFTAMREGDGKFTIRAEKDGTYRFCFSNQMSMMSHKTVKLALTTGEPLDISKLAKKDAMDNVERWIVSISHTVRMIECVFLGEVFSRLVSLCYFCSLGDFSSGVRWVWLLTWTFGFSFFAPLSFHSFHQQEYKLLHERHLTTVTATNKRVKWVRPDSLTSTRTSALALSLRRWPTDSFFFFRS